MKVCILVDEIGMRKWAADAIEYLLSSTEAEISCVVVNTEPNVGPPSFSDSIREQKKLLHYVRDKIMNTPEYLRYVSIDSVNGVSDAPHFYTSPIPLNDKIGHEIPDEIIEEIIARSDVVFRHGFGILRGRILTAPKYGVLSYHHGDIRRYRGAAQGFWNFINEEQTAGITLQQLNDELDGGEVVKIKNVNIESCYTYSDVRRLIFARSVPMLAEGIKDLKNPGFTPKTPTTLGPLYSSSEKFSLEIALKYYFKNIIGVTKCFLNEENQIKYHEEYQQACD